MLYIFHITVAIAASYTQLTWSRRGGDEELYVNQLSSSGAESLQYCGVMCYLHSQCFGFDWNESGSECELNDGAQMTLSTPQAVERGDEVWQNFGKPWSS